MTSDVSQSPRRRRSTGIPFFLAAFIARIARTASRMTGREGGALPGKLLMMLHPPALRRMRSFRAHGPIIMVSATNGKTTLATMLVGMLESAGHDVVHNTTGANLRSGIATTLLNARRAGDITVLEVDEATLPLVAPDLQPNVILLGNLFRDQLDRYGELEALADAWAQLIIELSPVAGETLTWVYAADDPLISTLVRDTVGQLTNPDINMLSFGIDDRSVAATALPHAVDSTLCRRCKHRLTYECSFVGHLGIWTCPNCENSRPDLDVAATRVELEGLAATRLTIRVGDGEQPVSAKLRIPGLYNAYNAVAATSAATAIQTAVSAISDGLTNFSPAFGRFERVPVPGGGTLTLLLVKNPTGLNEVVRTLVASNVDLTATLFALNDGIADGRDISWIWDADVEPLLQHTTALVVTGDRAAEFALRAIHGGLAPEAVLLESDIEQGLFRVLERAREFTTHGHAYALVTYTAMLRMRALITAQGWTSTYWANAKPVIRQ